MKNHFLIYLFILFSYNITAMNKSDSNNNNNYQLNNSFINDIQKYLNNGGDIDEFNDNGDTLLIVAVKNNDLQAVKFLLDNHALTSLINNKMKTALDYAKEIGNPQIIELLQQEHATTLEFWNSNYSGIDFDTLESNFHTIETESTLDNSNNNSDNLIDMDSDNFNDQNDPYSNLFDDIPDLAGDELSEFFDNSQNTDNQINTQNIEQLNTQDNAVHANTTLVNQDQNNQNNDTNTKKCSNNHLQCGICKKFFASTSSLSTHEKYYHLSTKAFKCEYDQCQKTFKSKYQLDRHDKYTHSTKKFKCPICDYKTSRKYDLKRHINAKHSDELSEFFDNLQNTDNQINTQNIKQLNTRDNAVHANTTLVNQDQNNQNNDTNTKKCSNNK